MLCAHWALILQAAFEDELHKLHDGTMGFAWYAQVRNRIYMLYNIQNIECIIK